MKSLPLGLLFIFSLSFGQQKYPEEDFGSPVGIPIVLSGTFGELRSDHFHAGVDIKTQQREGLPIFAVAAGYVSRIKVSLFGYGKTIYITHPNGYTTVYAHLSKFGEGIESYVKKEQYQKKRYEIGNLYLKPSKIPVTKGQIIGYSGSTGSSAFPHLHYEVRNTKSEQIINPLFFGIRPTDTIAPLFQGVFAYPIDNTSSINRSVKKTLLPLDPIGKNNYSTSPVYANGAIGFGVRTYDRLNGAQNKNGIYSLEMFVNGEKRYHHHLETFSFAESKYINLLIDYPHFTTYKERFQKTHRTEGNKLSIYKKLVHEGILTVTEGLHYLVEIVATDFSGNKSTVTIPVTGVKSNPIFRKQDRTAFNVSSKKFTKFTCKNVTVAFPKNSFYEDCYLDINVVNGIAQIHKPTIPLHKKYTLTFDVSKYSPEEKKQLYIANIDDKDSPKYKRTVKKDSIFYTRAEALGAYTLLSDKTPPKIQTANFKNGQWMTNSDALVVYVSDEESGIKSYRATVDGEWILMEYDLRKKTLTYDFNDKKLTGSKHRFQISVSDKVGNTNTLHATFYKKTP